MADDRCDLLCLDLPLAEAVRTRLPGVAAAERAAGAAKALADPTRLRIAWALARAGQEMCVCDLAWVTGASDKLVSHHVRILRTAGLAVSRRDGKMVLYDLTPEGISLVAALGEGVAA
jgi:DNA-binding transcriptional ArsR family regulator